MKELKQVKALVPYFDGGYKQWAMLTFTSIEGKPTMKFVMKEVRNFIQHNFNKRVSKQWVRANVLFPTDEPTVGTQEDYKSRMDKMVEAFIDRMELKDEDTNGGHTENQTSDSSEEARTPLRLVSDRPQEDTN